MLTSSGAKSRVVARRSVKDQFLHRLSRLSHIVMLELLVAHDDIVRNLQQQFRNWLVKFKTGFSFKKLKAVDQ